MTKSNINILVLTTTFPFSLKNDVGRHVLDKCLYLQKLNNSVKVICPFYFGQNSSDVIADVQIFRFKHFFPTSLQRVAHYADDNGIGENLRKSILAKIQFPIYMLSFYLKALRHMKNVDVIHAHWFPAGLIGVLLKLTHKKKLVLMMHHTHKPNFLYKLILKYSDYLFANSSYVLELTNKIHFVKNRSVLPVPIDYNVFKPIKNSTIFDEIFSASNEDLVYLISVGRLYPLKGYEYLIDAMNLIINKQNLTNFRLSIIGDGESYNDLYTRIKSYGLLDYIKLLGRIPNSDLPTYYSAADIFIIPSIIDENGETEGFGLVTLEANACGTPAIGTNVGGIPDIIEDGVNGFLVEEKNAFDLSEKIIQLINDKPLRQLMSKKAIERTNRLFTWSNVSKQITEVYQKLMEFKYFFFLVEFIC